MCYYLVFILFYHLLRIFIDALTPICMRALNLQEYD